METTNRLIFTDTNSINREKENFLKKEKYFNFLIEKYHEFQPFRKIENLKDAISLVGRPFEYFSQTVTENAGMKTVGGLSANVEAVCTIYGINIQGFKETLNKYPKSFDTDYSEKDPFSFVADGSTFFLFDNEKFNAMTERHKVYATSPAQIEFINYFEHLCTTLNIHNKKGFIPGDKINQIAQSVGLLSGGNEFLLNYANIAYQISNMK